MSSFFSDLDLPVESEKLKRPTSSFFSDLDNDESEEKPSRFRSLISAPIKGAIKSTADFTSSIPFLPKPIPKEYGLSLTEEFLPTQDELPEKVLERAGGIAPFAAIGGGGLASSGIRSLLGGLGGQAAEELGGGETAQLLGEMIGMSFPALSKSIVATKSQKPLVDFARRMGMTEGEIAPLIQGDKKQAILGKLSDKKSLSKSLNKSKEATSRIYKDLQSSPLAKNPLSQEQTLELMKGLKTSLNDMPQGLRKIAMKDILETFKGNSVDSEKLMNLYHDINYYVGKGNSRLGVLKDPIVKAIEAASPELAEDFKMTNELWKRRAEFGKKIRPGLIDDIRKLGRIGTVASGLFTGNYKPLLFSIGEGITQPIASKLITSPRLQNISRQIFKSVNESKTAQAQKLSRLLEYEIQKKLSKVEDPEK